MLKKFWRKMMACSGCGEYVPFGAPHRCKPTINNTSILHGDVKWNKIPPSDEEIRMCAVEAASRMDIKILNRLNSHAKAIERYIRTGEEMWP